LQQSTPLQSTQRGTDFHHTFLNKTAHTNQPGLKRQRLRNRLGLGRFLGDNRIVNGAIFLAGTAVFTFSRIDLVLATDIENRAIGTKLFTLAALDAFFSNNSFWHGNFLSYNPSYAVV
jgi:hypothetical protein